MHLCAKSCIAIAKYHMERGGNDLRLAKECLEKVANGNSEDVQVAADLLRKLKEIMPMNTPQATAPPSDGEYSPAFMLLLTKNEIQS